MSELVTPSVEPSYILPLALNTAPFSSEEDGQFFFRGEQIEQRFNLLLHLVRASDKVALLFAQQGGGKSTLLMQLQLSMADDVRLCRVNGKTLLEPPALTIHCLRELDVDEQEIQSSKDYDALLRQRCQQLQSLNVKPLVFIDDVDTLSEDSLSTIMNWLSWREDEQFLLQAVLTAQSPMPELKTVHGRVQRVDLPAFTEDELKAYLDHRLSIAGYQGELPFKTKDLKQIFKQSLGNPNLINQFAHQKLLGIKSPSSSISFIFSSIYKWLGVGLLVISLALLLIFQDKVNELFAHPDEPEIEPDEFSELIPEQTITTVIAEPELVLDAEEQGRAELELLIAELPVATIDPSEEGMVELTTKLEEEVSIQIDIKPSISEAQRQIPTVSYHQHQWILQQESTAYTFQLMGSWDEGTVTEFIDKNALVGDVAIFRSKRNDQIWYAVVYGVFESKEAALQASTTWPTPLNTLPKWLRRFDSVQQQVQK